MATKIASLFAEIGADTTGLQRGLTDTKTGLEKTKASLSSFAGGATKAFGMIAAEAVILKKVFDFGMEQAQLEYTRDKFDNLATSIGTTSDALMNDLRRATGGLVSDMELAASATDMMSLGLVKTHDEAVRLTKVAGQLGMDMNQLTLTLTNQTTMRFDSLGVSVDGFQEKVDALVDAGMNANDAFNEAFLQQAEEQVQTVGDVADSSAASFMRLGAAVKNEGDKIGKFLLPPLVKAATALELIITWNDKLKGAFHDQEKAVAMSASTYEEYVWQVTEAARNAKMLDDSQVDLIRDLDGSREVSERLMGSLDGLTEAEWLAVEAAEEVADTTDKVTGLTGDYADELDKLAGAQENSEAWSRRDEEAKRAQARAIDEAKTAAFNASKEFFNLADSYASMTNAQMAESIFASLREEMEKDGVVTADETAKLQAYGLELGVLTEKGIKYAETRDLMSAALSSGVISEDNAKAATDAYNLALKQGTLDMEALLEKYGETPGAFAEAQDAMQNFGEEGAGYVSAALKDITDTDAPNTEVALKKLGTVMSSEVAPVFDTFVDETIAGVKNAFLKLANQAAAASSAIKGVGNALEKLDGKTAHTYVYVHTYDDGGSGVAQPTKDLGTASWHEAAGSGGLSMVVPAGNPGDSFPVMVSSGEQVEVKTTSQQSQQNGNDLLIAMIRKLPETIGRAVRDNMLLGAA